MDSGLSTPQLPITNMNNEITTDWDKAMNLIMTCVSGHIHSRMFNIVMKLNICDILEDGPKSIKQVSDTIGMDENSCFRLLRYFVAHELFSEDKSNFGTFEKTSISTMFSSKGKLRPMGERYTHDLHYKMFESLPETFANGHSNATKSVGVNHFWELFDLHPQYKDLFNQTMKVYTEAAISNITQSKGIDFSQYDTVVDIGGNHGLLIGNLLEIYPTIKHGINFDLDVVINSSDQTLRYSHPRLTHIPGNFFESVPESDCYIMKFILHDWPTQDCVKILKTISKSMKPNAKIHLFEIIIDPRKGYSKYETYIDILMFQMVNAKERTLDEWKELFELADFKLERVVDDIKTGCMVVSKK